MYGVTHRHRRVVAREMSTSYHENITPKNRFQLIERQIKKEGEGERNYTENEISFGATIRRRRRRRGGG